jgi:HYR domain
MRHHAAILAVIVFLCSVTAGAGTITSLSPSSISVASAEHFLTVNGSSMGDQIIFDGPAGVFTVEVNWYSSTRVIVWIPQEVVNRSGTYKVTMRGRDGLSNSLTLSVSSAKNRFVLQLAELLIVPALSREGATVKYDVSWWSPEKEPEPPKIECLPASGSFFKFGTTRVDCVGTNYLGERDSASFTINVIDDRGPVVKVPRDIVTEQTEEGGAIVHWEASAYDDIDGDLPVSCSRTSGTLFPVGRTLVHCTAVDRSLNHGGGSFFVDVKGKAKLALRVPENLIVEADGPGGSRVYFEVEAYGTEDPEPSIKCDPRVGDPFKIGPTLVRCFAEDRFGQTAEAEFTVNVVDTLGPVLSELYTKPDYLVPVDGSMRPVEVVSKPLDLVDPAPRCSITGITANETISTDDWKIVSDREVALRARIGGKTDRIYRIAVTCYDENKNQTDGIATAVVPASGEAPKPGSDVKDAAATKRRPASGN